MVGMFNKAYAFNQPLNFETSSVTIMYQMFRQASAFNQPLNFSNTSNVTNMQSMFYQATSFNQPLNWDVSSVTDMGNMFFNVNLSTVNYDFTLIAWENYLSFHFPSGVGYTPNISVSFNTTQYTGSGPANAARTSLINNFGWTITDGGSI
jgi:hypothetical protein